jgi:hypothetical protein
MRHTRKQKRAALLKAAFRYALTSRPEFAQRPRKALRLGAVRWVKMAAALVDLHSHVWEETSQRSGVALIEWAAQAAKRIVDRLPKTAETLPIAQA